MFSETIWSYSVLGLANDDLLVLPVFLTKEFIFLLNKLPTQGATSL